MQPLPKEYNFAEIERKWQQKWEEMGIYHYDWNDKKRVPFSIDTPPPYPSGELHMGNVLNWTYFDMVARYKRMQGFNVLFPQGWDCHGLGIEIQVEKAKNIRKRDVPPDQFRAWCIELGREIHRHDEGRHTQDGCKHRLDHRIQNDGSRLLAPNATELRFASQKRLHVPGHSPSELVSQRRNRHRRRRSRPHKKRRRPALHTLPT